MDILVLFNLQRMEIGFPSFNSSSSSNDEKLLNKIE